MRYITITTDSLYQRLMDNISALADANVSKMVEADTDEEMALPFSPADAWDVDEEDQISDLGFLTVYYEKVHEPNADDYQSRSLVPVEVFESKAGNVLMRAYDFRAGFVKSFRLDAVQRILIRNQNLGDAEWGVRDITFRGISERSESL